MELTPGLLSQTISMTRHSNVRGAAQEQPSWLDFVVGCVATLIYGRLMLALADAYNITLDDGVSFACWCLCVPIVITTVLSVWCWVLWTVYRLALA